MPASDTSLKAALVNAGMPAALAADVVSRSGELNPAATQALDNTSLGLTTPGVVKASEYRASYLDSSGTPGAVTNNSPRGRVAFAAAAASVVVTNNLVTAASMVIATLRTPDTGLTSILRVLPAAGSFTIIANAASTGTAAQADFLVVN